MKLRLTIVIRDGMTWKDVRRALIATTNELKGDLVSGSDREVRESRDFHVVIDGKRVGRFETIYDEDEN